MKGSGWYGNPHGHSLAARGIKVKTAGTRKPTSKPYNIPILLTPYFSKIEKLRGLKNENFGVGSKGEMRIEEGEADSVSHRGFSDSDFSATG